MSAFTTAVSYGAIPLGASAIAGISVAIRKPTPSIRSAIQHAAAGVVFAAVALELLPEVSKGSVASAIVGFIVGIVVMYLMRRWSDHAERNSDKDSAPGLVVTSITDSAIDGLIVGASFAGGSVRQGAFIAIALATEMLFVGLSAASSVGGDNRWRSIAASSVLGVALIVGDVIGVLIFRGAAQPVLSAMFAFGAVALMYLVTEELLKEAHEAPERAWLSALFFVGFLGYLVLEMAS